MAGVSVKLDKRFYTQARGVFERYVFDVGVLEDGPHLNPISAQGARKKGWKKDVGLSIEAAKLAGGLKSFAGGPARRVGIQSDATLSEVSASVRERLGINIYQAPFSSAKNKDILNFSKSFFDLCAGRGEKRRVENYLQAIVRNPILRGDYGKNSPKAAKAKGFNRLLIDTGQLFKAIIAKVRIKDV